MRRVGTAECPPRRRASVAGSSLLTPTSSVRDPRYYRCLDRRANRYAFVRANIRPRWQAKSCRTLFCAHRGRGYLGWEHAMVALMLGSPRQDTGCFLCSLLALHDGEHLGIRMPTA